MKKIVFIILVLYSLPLYSQVVTVNDIVTLSTLSDKKLNSYIAKMGFVQIAQNLDNGVVTNEFFYKNKKQPTDSIVRFLSGIKRGKLTGVAYKTSSPTEYDTLLRAFALSGFVGGRQSSDSTGKDSVSAVALKDSGFFFQKEDMTVHVGEEIRDEIKVYSFLLEKKAVPTSSSVRFADDLLLFDSHEHLVALFGQGNVRRDMYFFSDTDSTRCSVIFPNSNRQAIFIWQDQSNYRGLSLLMIGGSLRAESSTRFDQSVSLSNWRSYSGLFTGMRLSEIIRVNEGDFSFFGTRSEFAYMAVPEKKGTIDFTKVGITLGCFNCSDASLVKKEKVSAEAAIDAGLQLYILSMVLIP